jgi:hypothetical protein
MTLPTSGSGQRRIAEIETRKRFILRKLGSPSRIFIWTWARNTFFAERVRLPSFCKTLFDLSRFSILDILRLPFESPWLT